MSDKKEVKPRKRAAKSPAEKKERKAKAVRIIRTFSKLGFGLVKIWLLGSPYVVHAEHAEQIANDILSGLAVPEPSN